ncbi:ribose ABC transporter, permease protein [Vulcanisaeta moutnovskia 768-28]|uniref:Ribose ABC transporter, permease protein n=1 Tax=Vulcanisaeta moutnovskia (strain 768-28) TaxID=985053 RepID=F0QYM0_VULM7|nr:ABC transporter permease [Vulcanisaeta moutnovskia]ADY01453.1 ribose ABC transporter, permease protein [Vulcanisaeta moutnovskia 768-28]
MSSSDSKSETVTVEKRKTQRSVLRRFLDFYNQQEIARPLIPFIVILIASITLSPQYFLSPSNLKVVLFQSAPITLLALGEGMVIIMGSIDLTPGSVAGLSALITGLVTLSTGNIVLAMTIAVLAGLAVGSINGLLVSKFKVYSFIATLAGLEIWRAVDLTITGGSPIYGLTQYSFFMNDFHTFIPLIFIIALAINLVFWYLLTRTTWGRIIYGIGSNEEAVRLAGTHADLAKFLTFAIAGLLYGLAGVMLVPTGGYVVDPWTAYGYELYAIAAAVLGGIALTGGTGHPIGPFFGALILTILTDILIIMGITQYTIQEIIIGIILIAAAPALTRGLRWVK